MNEKTSTREKILSILKKQNSRISGEQISSSLKISRVAIWKNIQHLREMGYTIDSSAKGYLFHNEKDYFTALEIPKKKENVIFFPSLVSTMKKSRTLIQNGCADKTIIIAESQKEGKSHDGGRWKSETGGLYMTYIRQCGLPLWSAPMLRLTGILATAHVLERQYKINCRISGFCDLTVKGKKLAGCISQVEVENDVINAYGLGIGVNINQKNLPEEAVSLHILTGSQFSRTDFLMFLEKELEETSDLFHCGPGHHRWQNEWANYSDWQGQKVSGICRNNEKIEGILEGIDESGMILCKTGNKLLQIVPDTLSLTKH